MSLITGLGFQFPSSHSHKQSRAAVSAPMCTGVCIRPLSINLPCKICPHPCFWQNPLPPPCGIPLTEDSIAVLLSTYSHIFGCLHFIIIIIIISLLSQTLWLLYVRAGVNMQVLLEGDAQCCIFGC